MDIQIIIDALTFSEPTMKHYPEPVERHKKALALALELQAKLKLQTEDVNQ